MTDGDSFAEEGRRAGEDIPGRVLASRFLGPGTHELEEVRGAVIARPQQARCPLEADAGVPERTVRARA